MLSRGSAYVGSVFGVMLAITMVGAGVLLVQPTNAAIQVVTIKDFAYQPATITINVGDSVTWTNTDATTHTATDLDQVSPAFDTGFLGQNESNTVVFNTPGAFTYFCQVHPRMRGALVVQVAATPTATTTVTTTPTATATATTMAATGTATPTATATTLAATPTTTATTTPTGPAIPITDPLPTAIARGSLAVRLMPLATELTAPNWGISAPGDTERLFVVDQNGPLWAVNTTTGAKTMFADFSSLLTPLGVAGPGTYDERGFLGVAFRPDYMTTGLLYTYTSEPAKPDPDFSTMPAGVAPSHENVVREWRVPNPANPASVVDMGSSRALIRSHHPQFNHDGGALNFGPDNMLYIAIGDGGNADDQGTGHAPEGNAQRLDTVLGKLLRIDPSRRTSQNQQYGIPADNPFVDQAGALAEIYAYGLRNPFRFSFDTTTGAIFAGDVGQNKIEEVNSIEKGGNYGWRIKEGTFLFSANGDGPGFVFQNSPGQPAELRDPIAQYDHDEGISVVGGFVYRGTAIPQLRGRYVFGDFARTFGGSGRLFYLMEDNQIAELRLQDDAELGIKVDGFGQDASGELYVLGNTTGTPSGTTGVVLKIIAAEPQVYLPLILK